MEHDNLQKCDKAYKVTKPLKKIFVPISWIVVACGIGAFLFFGIGGKLKTGVIFICISIVLFIINLIINAVYKNTYRRAYSALEESMLKVMGYSGWKYNIMMDTQVSVKSNQAVSNYDDVKFFKEDSDRLPQAVARMKNKQSYENAIKRFLEKNDFNDYSLYKTFEDLMKKNLNYLHDYYVVVNYTSPAGKKSVTRTLIINAARITELETDKSILMTKSEYNRYIKDQGKALLEKKQHSFYERVNEVIDAANNNRDSLVIRDEADELDRLIASLFDRTVSNIKKIKNVDSEEWGILDNFISGIEENVGKIIDKNQQILDYYNSQDFQKIRTTCDSLMDSQREFNEYIEEKVRTISSLFGTSIVRNETVNEDEYNYIHPYQKSITPFTAEVSATVFASAENNPLDYVVKFFYPNKERYPEQIQKLQTLIEELETLKEAKQIIENYKDDIQQYLTEVPSFIMENDKDGFYSRLGFATINESTLVVAYKFSYTSIGGKAQRYFTVPMTEETIVELINMLENKLTISSFTKEQRSLMTNKLRQFIKERDDYTCKLCGNSTHTEPNLLLEIDHIIPVSKGGYTEEGNLQTLCWKCNRAKSSKLI